MNIETTSRATIAIVLLCMFGAFAGYLIYKGTSEATVQLLAGALIAQLGQAIGWFFSSSAGSAAKDKVINSLTATPQEKVP